MMKKGWMKAIAAAVTALLLCACAAPEAEQSVKESEALAPIAVIYTNDVHCGVEDNLGYQGIDAVRQALELSGSEVFLVDNGDAVQGDLIGTLTEGEAVIALMNGLRYDAAIPGNHEFDYGMEQFLHLTALADFPYLSCNFTDADGEFVLTPYTVIEKAGRKIGLIGVSTPETPSSSTPSYFMNEDGDYIYDFCRDESGEKLYAAVQQAADAAKKDGAEIVIALCHLGIAAEASPWTSSDLITHTTGIDVVLDGHSHSVLEEEHVKNADGKEVLLSSTGTKMQTLGVLTVDADGTLHTALINSEASAAVAEQMQKVEEISATAVGETKVDLCIEDPATGERMVRSNETNLGDLVADAYRAEYGADVGISHGGNVRASIPKGEITYGDIIGVNPFGNEVMLAEVTGQQILDALEMGVSGLPGECPSFLQVSGMSYTVDVDIPSSVKTDEDGMFLSADGERRVKDVRIGSEPIDPQKTYTLAAVAYYLKEYGDGMAMFKDCKLIADGGKLDNQVLIGYIENVLGGTIGEEYADSYGQGRITIEQKQN